MKDHYCKTPGVSGRRDGNRWKCSKCGAQYQFKAPTGRFRRGWWMQIRSGK